MPHNQTLPIWLLLNACDFKSPSGFVDSRTGAAIYAGGLNLGDYFDLTEQEANRLSQTSVGTLHAGRYGMVQVDSGATQAYVKTGAIGLMVAGGQPNLNLVTSYDKGITGAHPVIFLNAITAGQYGFVQELGIANVLCGSSVTVSGSAGMGGIVVSASTGVIDCPTQSGNQTYAINLTLMGIALDPPMPGTKIRVLLELPVLQG